MKISTNVLLLCLTALLIAAMFRSPWPLPDTAPVLAKAATSQDASAGEQRERRDADVNLSESGRGRDVLPPQPWEVGYELPEKKLPELTAERIEVCLEVAADLDAQLASRLRAMHEKDPRRVARKLQGLHRLRSLAELKTHEPHLYELRLIEHRTDAEVIHLAREVRDARRLGGEQDTEALKEQLLQHVRLQVALHFKAREEYLCELQDYVAELEKQLEEERNNLDHIVEIRMQELLGEPEVRKTGPGGR